MYSLLTISIQQVYYTELGITCVVAVYLIYNYIKNRTLSELLLSIGGIFLLLVILNLLR